jgi:Ca2+-binding EF-hand superfamily protein
MNENERENFWKDVFILFDKENKGTIHFNLIHNYLQSVGIVIEKKEINKELKGKGYKEKEEYTFDELYNTFSSINTITKDDIINAFQVFDKKGKINKEELKYIMTNLGDKISEEEAETILSNFKIENGEIDYIEFLNKYNINE